MPKLEEEEEEDIYGDSITAREEPASPRCSRP